MNECIPKQTMYNRASNNKARVSRRDTTSPFGICLLFEVRFWGAHGLYQTLMVSGCLCSSRTFSQHPEIQSLSHGILTEQSFLRCLVTCALDTGPLRAKDLQCVAVIFLLFLKDKIYFFPPKHKSWDGNMWWFASKMFIHLNPLKRKRLWGSGNVGTWSVEEEKKKIPASSVFHSRFWLDYIFVKKKKKRLKQD